MRAELSLWWHAEFDYEWLPAFLTRHGLSRRIRNLAGFCCAAVGACAVLVQFAEIGPYPLTARIVMAVMAMSAFYAGLRWPMEAWPSERRSLWFVWWGEIGLSLLVLETDSTSAALPGCGLFVVFGIYITFAHSSRMLAAHLLLALTVCGAVGFRAAVSPHVDVPVLAVWIPVLTAQIVICPIVIHALVTCLKEDARFAYRDPLTNLLNRRGLMAAGKLLLRVPPVDRTATLSVVIDLDRFKRLNDGRGHADGDKALCAIAERLVRVVPPQGLVARPGGDEFAIVLVARADEVESVITAVHAAIYNASDSMPVTASTGAWVMSMNTTDNAENYPTLEEVLAYADAAMYEAKEAGGDRVIRHHL